MPLCPLKFHELRTIDGTIGTGTITQCKKPLNLPSGMLQESITFCHHYSQAPSHTKHLLDAAQKSTDIIAELEIAKCSNISFITIHYAHV